MDGKTTAIVSHITLIGWIIAFVTNNDKKDPMASFYIRQMLGLMIMYIAIAITGVVLAFIPFVGPLLSLVLFIGTVVFWVISLINAANGKMQPLPIVGDLFQDWFKSIG